MTSTVIAGNVVVVIVWKQSVNSVLARSVVAMLICIFIIPTRLPNFVVIHASGTGRQNDDDVPCRKPVCAAPHAIIKSTKMIRRC